MSEYIRYFREARALVDGHFVFSSDLHSGLYLNKDAALVSAAHAHAFARGIASWILRRFPEATVIVGPESGAVPLMADVRTLRWLMRPTGPDIAGVRALKTADGGFRIGKGQEHFVCNRQAVVVEDIATTGGSAKRAVEAVRAAGGDPVAVAFLWNRGGVAAPALGVKRVFSLIEEEVPSYHASVCPLCAAGIPINTELGHGKEFLAARAA